MKRFTIRSSSEWKATTTSRPPGASSFAAASRPRSTSPSSSFTARRSAWKLRVARSMPEGSRGVTLRMMEASRPVVVIGASRRAATMARAMRRE